MTPIPYTEGLAQLLCYLKMSQNVIRRGVSVVVHEAITHCQITPLYHIHNRI
jgi:hypothetical protein